MAKRNHIYYYVGIAILFIIGIIIIRNHNIIEKCTTINQQITNDCIHIQDSIQPSGSFNEDFSNFISYSETTYKQLFNRTTYINKQTNSLSDLASTIAEAAGLDQSSQLKISPDIVSSTVLILSANMGYADMILNFLCRLAKISKNFKYVVIAQDTALYNFLQSKKIPSISGSLIHPVSTENSENFRSPGFNAISIAKIIAARIVLELGYNILFSDVDIGWKKNPLSYLSSDVDLIIQSNSGTNLFLLKDEPNTGFYFLRSNDRSMALLDETIDRARLDPKIDDQTHFGDVLRDWRKSKKAFFIMEGTTAPWVYNDNRPFTFRILHPYLFQSGQVASFYRKLEPPNGGNDQDIVLIHANYMTGHHTKVDFLKSRHLWDLNDELFLTYLNRWKSNNSKNTKSSVSHQLALAQLTHICTDLVI